MGLERHGGQTAQLVALEVWWLYVKHTAKWVADGFIEYLRGYGENPRLVLLRTGVL